MSAAVHGEPPRMTLRVIQRRAGSSEAVPVGPRIEIYPGQDVIAPKVPARFPPCECPRCRAA